MMITKRNFCIISLVFMVLINFHLSSRSFKSTENTLASNTKSQTNVKSTETTTTKMSESEEESMMEEAMENAAALARATLREAAVHKAQKTKKVRAKEEAKIRSQEEAKLKEEIKAREAEKNKAKVDAKLKAYLKSNSTSNSTSEDDDKKKFEEKLEKAVKKRLAEMPTCKGGDGNGDGNGNGTGILGGTNVFDGKINATDAVGKVGFTNYSVVKPPYKVKRCDQILLLPGKKLNPKDYCEKEDAFMTMSIYMMNFFLKKDPNKLVESFNMYEITQIPSEMPGAPGCTMWMTKTRSFPFCYNTPEILEQVIDAYYAFMNCRKGPQGPRLAGALLKACDISKLDLTSAGPFGLQGPMYAQMIYAMDPSKRKKKPVNLDDINPYYIYEEKVHVPGSFLNNIKSNMNPYGKTPIPNSKNYGPITGGMFGAGR